MKRWLASAAACFMLVFADQFSKSMAVAHLLGHGYLPLIGDIIGLEYVENTGAAFGIFQNMQWLFICSSFLIFAVAFYLVIRLPYVGRFRPIYILLMLLISGACGNLIDRMRLGYVIDFIYFKLINFPVFNLADCYIVISVIVFIILILFYYKDEELEQIINTLGSFRKDRADGDFKAHGGEKDA